MLFPQGKLLDGAAKGQPGRRQDPVAADVIRGPVAELAVGIAAVAPD
jgi:hypothetical protein